jgi:uncharacterized membrane protein YhaH (DUF805 family)
MRLTDSPIAKDLSWKLLILVLAIFTTVTAHSTTELTTSLIMIFVILIVIGLTIRRHRKAGR